VAKKRAASRKPKRPKGAPAHLSDEAAREWDAIRVEYGIDDVAGLRLLTTAYEAFDRMRDAQARIQEEGITGPDRFGQLKPNPACVIERDSRAALSQLIRQLGIDQEEE